MHFPFFKVVSSTSGFHPLAPNNNNIIIINNNNNNNSNIEQAVLIIYCSSINQIKWIQVTDTQPVPIQERTLE